MINDLDRYFMGDTTTVAVTGASGYVGRHVCQSLSKAHFRVIPIVRQPSNQCADYFEFCDEPRISGDIAGKVDWTSVLQDVDVVIHSAGLIEHKDTHIEKHSMYYKVNVEATYQVAKAAMKNDVSKFIMMSSAGVYGSYDMKKAAVEGQVCIPSEPYVKSKYAAEEILLSATSQGMMQVAILRPPMIYGPKCKGNLRQLANMVWSPISAPLGAIDGCRNLLSVSSLCDGILCILQDADDVSGIWNIAEPDQVSVPEIMRAIGRGLHGKTVAVPSIPSVLLKAIATILGKRQTYEKLNRPVLIDGEKFSHRFNWQPKLSTLKAVERAAHSFRK